MNHLRTSSSHIYCEKCDREFTTHDGRQTHYANSAAHGLCNFCNIDFGDKSDLRDHYEEEHWMCGSCNSVSRTEVGRHEHARQVHQDTYCPSVGCRKFFTNANNLRMHLLSSIHVAASVKCASAMWRPGVCTRTFIDTSAMILHLESGTCPSRITRHQLDTIISQHDKKNLITNPRRMITGPTSSSSPSPTLYATEKAWNSYAGMYECYLCHNQFKALGSLNKHLASPRHSNIGGGDVKMYRCPLRACAKEYSTLSGLCQHIEKGSCGVSKFADVKKGMDDLVARAGRLLL
ncbi:hypothetical protein MNV49_003460 [Pseudohyphozyma bogoriensis]|nr:hypothetical protein MNV49_003460 [Pseudohyphozyma bogoriensis]